MHNVMQKVYTRVCSMWSLTIFTTRGLVDVALQARVAMEQRKRKISVEGPPGGEEEEVIGPLPVGSGGGTKKRKGWRWREI